ncbi:hypothetical protein SAMN05216570_0969 [Dyella sp. OK004]|uniref:hypothetical protein n=1 Tax=Dyella sp. OK004 TaxID=1855292 RepID=UPI0008E6DEBB|nr:hypothetical protein [Dyella sp. OK004]SFR94332.1 hypothetical protein SAMN05216570_0969 [Dyella sp. OK004]
MLNLPYIPESVLTALRWGSIPESSPHTHREIAEWCDQFWCHFMDVDAPAEIERLLPVLADVDVQWDLFLANTYTFEQLRTLNLNDVRLPTEWFDDWARQAQPGSELSG